MQLYLGKNAVSGPSKDGPSHIEAHIRAHWPHWRCDHHRKLAHQRNLQGHGTNLKNNNEACNAQWTHATIDSGRKRSPVEERFTEEAPKQLAHWWGLAQPAANGLGAQTGDRQQRRRASRGGVAPRGCERDAAAAGDVHLCRSRSSPR